MTPERWQQVKEIFNSAIKYGPEQRGRFLSQACSGDEELRSEVELLITSHEKEGSFIDEIRAICEGQVAVANGRGKKTEAFQQEWLAALREPALRRTRIAVRRFLERSVLWRFR